jgi:hypothetical protein
MLNIKGKFNLHLDLTKISLFPIKVVLAFYKLMDEKSGSWSLNSTIVNQS